MIKISRGFKITIFLFFLLFLGGYLLIRLFPDFLGKAKPVVTETYVACGCGCCYDEPLNKQCLYHSKGDSLAKVITEDENVKNSGCELVGCSAGIEYEFCD